MKKQSNSSIQESVLQQIAGGHVHMHSRLYFSLITVATVGAGVVGGVLLAYIISIATFIVRIQTAATPAYGARENLADALAEFPWWLLLLAAALIALAIWLMRRYGRAYRHSVLSIVAVFVLVGAIVGAGLSFIGVGERESGQTIHGRDARQVK